MIIELGLISKYWPLAVWCIYFRRSHSSDGLESHIQVCSKSKLSSSTSPFTLLAYHASTDSSVAHSKAWSALQSQIWAIKNEAFSTTFCCDLLVSSKSRFSYNSHDHDPKSLRKRPRHWIIKIWSRNDLSAVIIEPRNYIFLIFWVAEQPRHHLRHCDTYVMHLLWLIDCSLQSTFFH